MSLPPNPELLNTVVAAAQEAPVPIKSVGWSPTTYGVWALVVIMSPIVLALFRMWPAMKKLRNEADGSLRADLLKELESVRADLKAERADCERRMQAMQNKMDAVTRQFVQFQLTVVRYMPEEYAPAAQRSANKLLDVIARDIDEFAPEAHDAASSGEGEANG